MRDLEHIEGVALMRWAKMSQSRLPELKWLFHVPNGGARGQVIRGKFVVNKAAVGKLKAEGVKKGVSDYVLPAARGGYFGLFLELKAGKNYPQPEQREFLADMREAGYRAEWARGWEACVEVIEEYLALPATAPQIEEIEG